MKIGFQLLDTKHAVRNERNIIELYGKTDNGDKIILIDDYLPYFYAEIDDSETIKRIRDFTITEGSQQIRAASVTRVKKSLHGKKKDLIKIACNTIEELNLIYEGVKDAALCCYEHDVNINKKYLIDRELIPLTRIEAEVEKVSYHGQLPCYKLNDFIQGEDDPELNIFAIDIETYNPLGKKFLPKEHPILMIGIYGKNFKKVITWKKFKDGKDVEFVKDESELLLAFEKVIHKYDPDIITGWFSDGFDMPYIDARAKHHKIKLKLGLDGSEMKVKDDLVRIVGRPHLDIYKFIRRTMGSGLETNRFGLNDVANEILGEKKHDDIKIDGLAQAWDDGDEILSRFAKYNLQDAKLTYLIFEKVFPNLRELVKIIGINPFDVNRMGFSQLVEWFIIKQAKNYNELVPNKPDRQAIMGRRDIKFQGAFVFEPKPGLYDNIVVFDFRSLYPSIIVSHNISPSTISCDCCRNRGNHNPEDRNIWFCENEKGFISLILEDIITRRSRIKQIIREGSDDRVLLARMAILKLLANSFYGYLGFYAARWYCIECAKTVTSFGRHYIQKVIEEAGNNGFKIIYSDTDSIFIALEENKRDKAIKLVDDINRELPGLMELEFEGFYPRGIFVKAKMALGGAKKRYALIDKKDRLKITGFEAVRRNVSIIAKETQEKILQIILKENDKDKAVEFVKGVINELREGNIDRDKLLIYTRISKELDEYDAIGPHVAVARRMKERGEEVGQGSTVRYIICKGSGIIRDRAKTIEEAENENYDAEYYIDHQVIPAVDSIFRVLDVNKEDLTLDSSQSNLKKFF